MVSLKADRFLQFAASSGNKFQLLEHIDHVARMSVFWIQRLTVQTLASVCVSLSKSLYLHCFSRISCELSTRWGHPFERCSVL